MSRVASEDRSGTAGEGGGTGIYLSAICSVLDIVCLLRVKISPFGKDAELIMVVFMSLQAEGEGSLLSTANTSACI